MARSSMETLLPHMKVLVAAHRHGIAVILKAVLSQLHLSRNLSKNEKATETIS